jgi:hypothetical protein
MFRFTIREILLLTALVGLAVGWWLDHRRLESARTGSEMGRRAWQTQFDRLYTAAKVHGFRVSTFNGEWFLVDISQSD